MANQFPLQGDIVFDAKPDAVPYNYRISYKVSQLCLIMYICGWGTSCSLIKLHMISFALLSRKNMDIPAFRDGGKAGKNRIQVRSQTRNRSLAVYGARDLRCV